MAFSLFAAATALAFDSAEWHERREVLLREAERLQAAYSNCLASAQEPAEDIKVPVETFPDGSVRTVVAARRARFFMSSGLIWAEGVVIQKFAPDGSEESRIDAASCVVDRTTKSGWAEGPARVRNGGTTFRGSGVYFSSPESYVRVFRDSEIDSTDLDLGEGGQCRRLRVRSAMSDIDRNTGVVLQEGDVEVEHSDGYWLRADRAYMFLTASNELSRVVASGNVVLTNATRSATCPLATYRRARREVEMFGDGDGSYARLVEGGAERRELEGRRIRFWLDTEQVEVDAPRITVGKTGGEAGK